MNRHSGRVYTFGRFKLDIDEQVLLRNGEQVRLEPRNFKLLVALVENRGHLLTKNELMKHVWEDSFVEENNLAVSISKLRNVLSEGGADHPYIETVPRRGCRFVGALTEPLHEGSDLANAAPTQTNVYATSGSDIRADSGTMAILPFKTIGQMRDQYLGLGMADALITRLSNLRQVAVRPTSSVRKYNGAQDPVLAGKDLRVQWVLDGSLQRAGKRMRVTVQLVNVSDEVSLWAGKFDEKFTDVFAVEDSISEQVAKALAVKLTGKERRLLAKRYTENVEAYEAHLKGRYFFGKRTKEGLEKGIGYFKRAIAIDPNYALAYAGMADCYIVLRTHNVLPPRECVLMAETALLSALQLDADLSEAHASLGHLKTRQWDWSGAEKEFRTAIDLNPNYATAHHWYSVLLRTVGRLDEAMFEIKRAQEIDPISLIINASVGLVFFLAKEYDRAAEQFRGTIELDSGFAIAHFFLGLAYEAKREYTEALTEFEKALSLWGDELELLACVGRIYALSGRRDKALKVVDELRSLSKESYVAHYFIALIYAGLEDKDEAIQSLEKGYAERDEDLALLNVDPRMDLLRGDPRFMDLVQGLGLAEGTNRRTLETASGGRPG